MDKLAELQPKQSLVDSYCEVGKDGLRVAETLIRYCAKSVAEHQYLTYGWSAVTRNLDENFAQIYTRFARASRIAQRLPQIKQRSQLWVKNFNAVVDALQRVC